MVPRVLGVVVNYNGADLASRTAGDIVGQRTTGLDLSVLVVDNGSSPDDYLRLVATLPSGATLIRLERNGGYAAACNVATKHATERQLDFVWFLNSDLRVPDTALLTLISCLQAAPQAAAAVPVAITATHPPTVLSAGVRIGRWTAAVHHQWAGEPVQHLPDHPFAADAIEGAAMLVRVSAIEKIGPLDETYFMYWEDTDWSYRARQRGHALLVAPSVLVTHGLGQSSSPALRIQYILVNRVRFMRTHAHGAELLFFVFFFFLGWLPLYTVLRLVPGFGVRVAARIAWVTVARNAREALAEGWRRRPISA